MTKTEKALLKAAQKAAYATEAAIASGDIIAATAALIRSAEADQAFNDTQSVSCFGELSELADAFVEAFGADALPGQIADLIGDCFPDQVD
jgi:hypothetical protein